MAERTMRVHFGEDGWPDVIPWPCEGEWTTGRMTDDKGRCCLSGWMHVAWTGQPHGVRHGTGIDAVRRLAQDQKRKRAAMAFQAELQRIVIARGFSDDVWDCAIARFNNDPSTTDADRMAVWAEAWGKFGYEPYEVKRG